MMLNRLMMCLDLNVSAIQVGGHTVVNMDVVNSELWGFQTYEFLLNKLFKKKFYFFFNLFFVTKLPFFTENSPKICFYY